MYRILAAWLAINQKFGDQYNYQKVPNTVWENFKHDQ